MDVRAATGLYVTQLDTDNAARMQPSTTDQAIDTSCITITFEYHLRDFAASARTAIAMAMHCSTEDGRTGSGIVISSFIRKAWSSLCWNRIAFQHTNSSCYTSVNTDMAMYMSTWTMRLYTH